jgi:hypothetical protein
MCESELVEMGPNLDIQSAQGNNFDLHINNRNLKSRDSSVAIALG